MTATDADGLGPLGIELKRLDLLLHRQILRLRKTYQLSLDEFRGLYVSDERVDRMLSDPLDASSDTEATPDRLLSEAVRLRGEAVALKDGSTWGTLSARLGLSDFEKDVLILSLAPQLNLKYEVLYGYLNDDVGRRWPTRDLALRLFIDAPTDRSAARARLQAGETLFASALLDPTPADSQLSWLAEPLRPAPGLADYLLGQGYLDPRLGDGVRLVGAEQTEAGEELLPSATGSVLQRHGHALSIAGKGSTVLLFEGVDSNARTVAAHYLARTLDAPLLHVDLRLISAAALDAHWVARLLLCQRLTGAVLLLDQCEKLFDEALTPTRMASKLVQDAAAAALPLVLGAGAPLPWTTLLIGKPRAHLRFDLPTVEERERLWRHHGAVAELTEETALGLAARYVLSGAQIHDTVVQVNGPIGAPWANGGSTSDRLVKAIRNESNLQLAKLAKRVESPHEWGDLVLPDRPMNELREVAHAIRNRHVVYRTWGFGRRLTEGRGVKALFAGTSGTGKTMAAGIVANDIGLDLYAINLATIVSKYIGETERNLDRVFTAAENSNAILFFDEADALYGKRSEVKDAHDRYANIEVSYLLQKMEAYEGAVILASNLKGNIDEAFSRRMHYIIDFPRPDAGQRLELWRGMFPAAAPVCDDADLTFLADQFELSGGEIKNAALDAAFLAARHGSGIGMTDMIRAVSRQLQRKGAVPSRTQLKQYYELIG